MARYRDYNQFKAKHPQIGKEFDAVSGNDFVKKIICKIDGGVNITQRMIDSVRQIYQSRDKVWERGEMYNMVIQMTAVKAPDRVQFAVLWPDAIAGLRGHIKVSPTGFDNWEDRLAETKRAKTFMVAAIGANASWVALDKQFAICDTFTAFGIPEEFTKPELADGGIEEMARRLPGVGVAKATPTEPKPPKKPAPTKKAAPKHGQGKLLVEVFAEEEKKEEAAAQAPVAKPTTKVQKILPSFASWRTELLFKYKA